MRSTANHPDTSASWPPEQGDIVTFHSRGGLATGVVKEVRRGLVWQDFILEDGRVIPEHKIQDHPEPPVWRKPEDVPQKERECWERRLVTMAESGMDPREHEQTFWAELNQYLAYTYLRFKQAQREAPES